MSSPSSKQSFLRSLFPAIPGHLLLAMGLVLLLAAAIMVASTARDEEQRMLTAMKGQADVLIWALEGATRSMAQVHSPLSPTRKLVEEVAKQPNIAYLAVTGPDGKILAHSEPAWEGVVLPEGYNLRAFSGLPDSRGRFITVDGERIYEVIKPFTPSVSHHMMMRRGTPKRWVPEPQPPGDQEFYVLVGIDPEPFAAVVRSNVLASILLAGLVVLFGVTCLALFFVIRNFLASNRMLRDARSLTAQVFENLPIGIFTTDSGGRITLFNTHIAEKFGMDASHRPSRLVHDYPVLDWKSLMREMDGGSPILERELSLGRAGEEGSPVSVTAARITTSAGESRGYLFIVRDLGEVKKLQQQVRRNERLSALGNLAAGVAHEIRNPLSSIKGYATYLAGKFTEEDPAHRKGRLMIQEVERLNRVVSDLLSVAKIGAINPRPAALRPVLEHALRLVEPEAASRRIRLEEPDWNPAEGCVVSLDADRLVQAVLNLLINAVQATEAGGMVRLGLSRARREPGAPETVRVSVSDTGCGMSEDVLSNLFTPYFTTKASGTGLGLTIAHQIIEQHGGDISVHSRPGEGSVFTVTLPISSAP